jgi:hypothetical protein
MSDKPERAVLTSAALCPDGAAGGVVGHTQGACRPRGPGPRFFKDLWVQAGTAPPLAACSKSSTTALLGPTAEQGASKAQC